MPALPEAPDAHALGAPQWEHSVRAEAGPFPPGQLPSHKGEQEEGKAATDANKYKGAWSAITEGGEAGFQRQP